MKLTYEISFEDFAYNKCWGGAKETIEELTADDIRCLNSIIEDIIASDCDPDGYSETDLNDFLWFETDTIANWLGYNDWDDLLDKHKERHDED